MDSLEAGKESSSETGPEGVDASSSEAGADGQDATSSTTKEGYEEKMVRRNYLHPLTMGFTRFIVLYVICHYEITFCLSFCII